MAITWLSGMDQRIHSTVTICKFLVLSAYRLWECTENDAGPMQIIIYGAEAWTSRRSEEELLERVTQDSPNLNDTDYSS